MRFIILLLARWTCPNNRPTYPTYLMCRIGTAKFFTLLLLLYHTSVKLPEEEAGHIGIWGQRHRRYLKTHRKALYTSLLTSGKLNSYLVDIDHQAEEMFLWLVKQFSEYEGVTECLKTDNQMEWVARINNIRSRATEIVNNDLIYN